MSSIDVPLKDRGFGSTRRTDNWWVEPILVFLGYMALSSSMRRGRRCRATTIYASTQCGTGPITYRPMYSPLLYTSAPAWWPAFLPFSAAMLILPFPGLFPLHLLLLPRRLLQSFLDGSGLVHSRGQPRKTYRGEKKFPLILQNVHRYFLYFAIIFVFILLFDGYRSLWFTGADGVKACWHRRGIAGVDTQPDSAGRLHLRLPFVPSPDRRNQRTYLSGSPGRKKAYDCVSCLNRSHMKWAWVSMFFVGFADVYVRLCAAGVWHDWRIF